MTQKFRFDENPPCESGEQVDVLFTSPGWACWLYGMVTNWGGIDGLTYEILLYDQQRDKYEKWDSKFPEYYMLVPDVPTS